MPAPTPTTTSVIDDSNRTSSLTTPLGANASVAVMGPDASTYYDQLTWTILEIQRLLGVAYPSASVELVLDAPVLSGKCGEHTPEIQKSSTTYTMTNSTIQIDPNNCVQGELRTIFHVTANACFGGDAAWLDAGLAGYFEYRLILMDTPWSEPAPFIPESRCDHYRNISELESGISSPAVIFESPPVAGNLVARQPESRCPYTLSAGLFLALEEHLGADAFVSAVANLARERTGLIREERGIDDVRLVFADYGKEALNIIDLWYEGNPKMLFYTHNNSIDWETAPTVTSTGELVMVGYAELGSMFTDRQDNYCSQFELVDPSNRYSYSLLVLQRRFLSLVSFGVKIALLDPMPQSCQGCGVIAKKWFQIPFLTNHRCNTRKPTVIVGHLAALIEFKGACIGLFL